MICISFSVYCWFISVSISIPAGNRIHPRWFKRKDCKEGTTHRVAGGTKRVNTRWKVSEAPRDETAGSYRCLWGLKRQDGELVLPVSPVRTEPWRKSSPLRAVEMEALSFCQTHITRRETSQLFSPSPLLSPASSFHWPNQRARQPARIPSDAVHRATSQDTDAGKQGEELCKTSRKNSIVSFTPSSMEYVSFPYPSVGTCQTLGILILCL